ncbi:MAG TPA: hypothetical protein VIH85_18610 [Solirubrobacteraceae bacterium]|jgi:NAD(P)-dependent dehydrogenase (short-subunit alcohol dehydrogenase family)
MSKTIVITGASSGFGALSARALADAGHVAYAGMRDIDGHNATQAAEAKQYAAGHDVDLRPVELDVSSQRSVDDDVVAEYDAAYPNLMADVSQRLAEQAPPDPDVADVAAAVVNAVGDRIRAEFLTRIGLQDLLRPRAPHVPEVSRR